MASRENLPISEETRADFSSFDGLRSAKSTHRLNQIARVRANGVGDHVSLPQLVVCGDQSAGKSSVLEGVTGIPFPRQDGVCTKFATEIILHHDENVNKITASVIPHAARTQSERDRIQGYHRLLTDVYDLPSVIEEVTSLMQLRESGTNEGLAFSEDVLRIEVVGLTGLHLTVVDLPGLISVANEEQTEEDVHLVARLVDNYLQSTRTIILAVVQANNDIANQAIIQRARKFDKTGQRTVGIITKPDLINKGTEGRIALLAKNQDTTKLKLGYFLLKNPTPEQLEKGISLAERKQEELSFFSSGPWKVHQLDPDRLGISALRDFLQDLLDRHIERELPMVRQEIKILLSETERQLAKFGDERPTLTHMRMFLTRRSMEFCNLAQAALIGNYYSSGTNFFSEAPGQCTRLRAKVHELNTSFANNIRVNGAKRKVISTDQAESELSSDDDSSPESGKLLVTEGEFDSWVKKTYLHTRGRELPGNYNHILLAELFHEQSGPWSKISEDHIFQLFTLATNFLESALDHVFPEDYIRQEILRICIEGLEDLKKMAFNELQNLLSDERLQPITYNHYYTDTIQRAREEVIKNNFQQTIQIAVDEDFGGKLHVSNTEWDSNKLFSALRRRVFVDMDAQACAEASSGLKAYYKVAMKTFVDNVCRQVIERHLLSKLPDLFAPTTVLNLSDEDLMHIASEPEKQRERRAALGKLAQSLKESLLSLQK